MEQILLSKENIEEIMAKVSAAVFEDVETKDRFAIIGVQTRGVELANRIKEKIEAKTNTEIKFGVLDITFHRDDLTQRGSLPEIKETRIDFAIDDLTILLVDDVIYSGRTTKAAIESLMTFGRPRQIKLFTLVDRGNRDLPIQPDYCECKVATIADDKVKVRLEQTDAIDDQVILVRE